MGAPFDNAPLVEHDDLVGAQHRTEPMSYDKTRASSE